VKIVRSVLSVVVGFLVFAVFIRMLNVFTGVAESGGAVMNFLVLSVTWTVAAAVIAGYTTARIAGSREFPHAAALGLLMVIVSFASMRQEGITQPGWYQTTIAGCGPISAMIGAAIRLLTKGRQTVNGTANRNTSADASRR
jgi:hypothetical protein